MAICVGKKQWQEAVDDMPTRLNPLATGPVEKQLSLLQTREFVSVFS